MKTRLAEADMETEESYQLIKKLQSKYDNMALRSLIALAGGVPIFGMGLAAGDAAIKGVLEKMYLWRRKIFYDELAAGNIHLTDKLIQDEDFLYCYFATIRAVDRTRRKEKIKLIARLLEAGQVSFSNPPEIDDGNLAAYDEFDSMLRILNDLDYTEIQILDIIDQAFVEEIKNPGAAFGVYRANYDWGKITNEMVDKLGIDRKEIPSALYRLQRTGLFQIGPGIFDLSSEGGASGSGFFAQLLPTYKRFKEAILMGRDETE